MLPPVTDTCDKRGALDEGAHDPQTRLQGRERGWARSPKHLGVFSMRPVPGILFYKARNACKVHA